MADRDDNGRFIKGHSYRFRPGVSGNPGGRPRDYRISDAIRKEIGESHHSPITIAEGIGKRLVQLALEGNIYAIREVLDRMEGKPHQSIAMEVTTTEDWRAIARQEGLDEAAVIAEVKRLIESADEGGTGECAAEDAGSRERES